MDKRSPEADWAQIGHLMSRERVTRGWSKTKAASAAGVSLSTYRLLEKGTPIGVTKSETLATIAGALGLDLSEIFLLAGRSDELADFKPKGNSD